MTHSSIASGALHSTLDGLIEIRACLGNVSLERTLCLNAQAEVDNVIGALGAAIAHLERAIRIQG